MASKEHQIIKAMGVITHKPSSQDALQNYCRMRVEHFRGQLEQAATLEEVRGYQAAIKELNRFLQLKEVVENIDSGNKE